MAERDLQRRIAIVTGVSRRQGIGAAIARKLAERGADLFLTYWQPYDQQADWSRDDHGPTTLQAELQAKGGQCESYPCDLSLPTTPVQLLDEVNRRMGAPAILVNNATYSTNGNYQELDAAQLDAHYAVNLRGTALLSVEFCRRFSGEAGRIINLTSGSALGPMPGELAYAATKGAIEAFTRSLADAVMERGITVNSVNPGPTDTGWMNDQLKQHLTTAFPTGRVGQPDDVARLIAFLASDEARWITGQILNSEGGFRRG